MESSKKPAKKPRAKKRGRKPHGGIVISPNTIEKPIIPTPNMVVHLKCKISDLKDDMTQVLPTHYDPTVEQIMGYSGLSLPYEEINDNTEPCSDIPTKSVGELDKQTKQSIYTVRVERQRNIYAKLCFYCGCGDRSIGVSIPVSNDESMGQFCRPECAAGFLMKHTPDVSMRYDRYQRLNAIYGKSGEQIKIAPEPYYLLKHYCGEMTSKEYHDMIGVCDVIETSNMIRIIPRIVDETDVSPPLINNARDISTSGKYQVRTASNFFNAATHKK